MLFIFVNLCKFVNACRRQFIATSTNLPISFLAFDVLHQWTILSDSNKSKTKRKNEVEKEVENSNKLKRCHLFASSLIQFNRSLQAILCCFYLLVNILHLVFPLCFVLIFKAQALCVCAVFWGAFTIQWSFLQFLFLYEMRHDLKTTSTRNSVSFIGNEQFMLQYTEIDSNWNWFAFFFFLFLD